MLLSLFLIPAVVSFETTNIEQNVLFLGNSYTYFHNMPNMVQSLAASVGLVLNFDEHLQGGWSWKDVSLSTHSPEERHC